MKLFIGLCCLVGLAASKPVPQDEQQPPSSDLSRQQHSDSPLSSETAPSDFSATGTGLSPTRVFGGSSNLGSGPTSSVSFGDDSDGAFIAPPPEGFSSVGSSDGSVLPLSSDGSFQDPAVDPNSGFESQFPSGDGSISAFAPSQSDPQSFSADGTQFVGDSSNFDAAFAPPGAVFSQSSPDSGSSSDEEPDNSSGGLFGFGKKK